MINNRILFTNLYIVLGFLLFITPVDFYSETKSGDVFIKVIVFLIPYMLYIFDGETYVPSFFSFISFFTTTPGIKVEVVNKLKESKIKFPIDCLSVLKFYNYKFDSPKILTNVSNKIIKFADTQKLNLKAVRQQNGLRVNSYVFSVDDYYYKTKGGIEKKETPKQLKLTQLADELKRILGGKYDVQFDLVPGSQYVQYITTSSNQNKAGLGNILRSDKFAEIVQYNKLNQVINLPVGLGVDLKGTPLAIDLKKGPHFRLIGSTGSGKSVAATTILTSLCCVLTPDELDIHIIDLKMVDFTVVKKEFPHVSSLEFEIEGAEQCLDNIIDEMNYRYNLLKDKGYKDLTTYNNGIKNKEDYIPQIVLLVDEFAELLGSHSKPEVISKKIIRIAQLSRAAGITLILGSQRLDAGVTNPLIRANTPSCFALKTSTAVDSRVAIDQNGCEKLLPHGDCLLKYEDDITRMQFCMVTDDELRRLGKMWKIKNEE